MNFSVQRWFAKILVIPTIFSFALSCCQPMFAQAAQSVDGHIEVQLEEAIETTSGPAVQEDHDCDHPEHHEESTLRTLAQKIATDFALPSINSSAASRSPIDSDFVVCLRITGPPWDGKSIKAFLGVYRS